MAGCQRALRFLVERQGVPADRGKVVLQFCQNGGPSIMLSPEIVIREIRQVVLAHSVVLMRI